VNRRLSNLRFLFPVVASGLLSFALCAAMAVFLYREQDISADALKENIDSHQAAAELEESLSNLVALLQDRVEGVAAVNDRIEQHIATAERLADQPQEKILADRVDASFRRYLEIWRNIPERPGQERDAQLHAALHVIESETVKACHNLREHNTHRIRQANDQHTETLRQLAWGLAAIGGSAGLAGLFLGYGVARGLSRSIQRLQVRVQDAAGLLGRDFPPIELTGDANLENLDRQVQVLAGRIEQIVEQLRQRDREVRRAEQLAAVGQIAAGMAHEIRNPLTSIKMLIQTASEDGPGGLPHDDLGVIEREIRRVERSLQTFLDFARPPKPSKAPTDLATVVRETLELTRGRAAKQRVVVRFEPPFKTISVDADPIQLRQVLVNLVLNALDAMPGGGTLTIVLRADGPISEISVTDTGPGIAADFRHRLFEPFASTRETGLGLGLVICRRIVEDHGGSIDGENLPGGGAKFTVKLPRLGSVEVNGRPMDARLGASKVFAN
jgi:two-component system, NtrC family, sensor histidine kinase HydH